MYCKPRTRHRDICHNFSLNGFPLIPPKQGMLSAFKIQNAKSPGVTDTAGACNKGRYLLFDERALDHVIASHALRR